MPAILCDHDVEGHLNILVAIWRSPEWIEVWEMVNCDLYTFHSLAIPPTTPDSAIWNICQQQGFILLTGNRNADSEDSLEIASQRLNRPDSLPVLTIADAERVLVDRAYAESVASRILDLILDI